MNTKARHLAILGCAKELLVDIDVTREYPHRELAKELVTLTDCHYSTARRVLAKAARIKRGEIVKTWGGRRRGGGRPKKKSEEQV